MTALDLRSLLNRLGPVSRTTLEATATMTLLRTHLGAAGIRLHSSVPVQSSQSSDGSIRVDCNGVTTEGGTIAGTTSDDAKVVQAGMTIDFTRG